MVVPLAVHFSARSISAAWSDRFTCVTTGVSGDPTEPLKNETNELTLAVCVAECLQKFCTIGNDAEYQSLHSGKRHSKEAYEALSSSRHISACT